MIRKGYKLSKAVAVIGMLALPSIVAAQGDKQIVAVLEFTNGSFGPGAKDYDLAGKGIQDLLTTELASTASVRVVDRAHIQAVMDEQHMTRDQLVDPATAIKLGKILGAQYLITGGFMYDGKSTVTLNSRSINVATTQVGNPEKVEGKSDDMMGAINKLVSKTSTDLKLPAFVPGSAPAPAPAPSASAGGATKTPAAAATPAASPAKVDDYAKALPAAEQKATSTAKLDFRTNLIYGKAIDAYDNHDTAKAKTLFKQVVAASPGFGPANDYLAKLN